MNGRPKLLFLAWPFPPLQASASVRTWNIAKHLVRLGWDVTVVTPNPSDWRAMEDPQKVIVELEREGIQRILTGHRWRCLSPYHLNCRNRGVGWFAGGVCRKIARHLGIDEGIGWIKEAERACSHLTANDVNVILATGKPFASFQLAKRLSEKLGCPYVLDYRDPWTTHRKDTITAPLSTMSLEKDLVDGSAAVTMVSPSILDSRFKLGSKRHVITNGYDPEEMEEVKSYEFGHFAIVYTGIFYPPKTVITPLVRALKLLQNTERTATVEWRLHYYGPQGDHVQAEMARAGLRNKVVIHGKVPRAEALSAIKGSGVTVVITSVSEDYAIDDKWIVTGKLFDALGSKVPTLVIGPSGADIEPIIESTGLARRYSASNINGMASFLAEVMSGRVPKATSPETYAWPNIVKRLDVVLRDVIAKKVDAGVVTPEMSTCSEEVDDGKRFEFGKNWSRFLSILNEERILVAERSLLEMLDCENLTGKRFLDVGSGSGLFSLAARRLGARVHSFDFDPHSVACTLELKRRYFPDDINWTIEQGSILNLEYIKALSHFDIVYSWGVLHHTGAMWQALDNVQLPVSVRGRLCLAIYNDQGVKSKLWRRIKKIFCSGLLGKLFIISLFVPYFITKGILYNLLQGQSPLRPYSEYKSNRGMSVLTDWIDWLGGYPFEVANAGEIVNFYLPRGFALRKMKTCGGSNGNNEFIFEKIK